MIKTAQQLNYRTQQLKLVRDRTSSLWDSHRDTFIYCLTSSQTSLDIACLKGRRLRDDYVNASKKLRGF